MSSESVANRKRPNSLIHETCEDCEKGDLSMVKGWNTFEDDFPLIRF